MPITLSNAGHLSDMARNMPYYERLIDRRMLVYRLPSSATTIEADIPKSAVGQLNSTFYRYSLVTQRNVEKAS
ncbi:MAG: hypothetical protein EOO61_20650 [Hymenobacter sp.]|nr:MAG: hypothetical protein EOO61_20650 [Hymenobacter sp.]